ncbi:MAG: hypothetical protein AAGC70_00315 [Pseudomonadota bacterium]
MLAKVVVLLISSTIAAHSVLAMEIPKEVTPDIRRACEKDVRRLCVRKTSTVSSVKSCVIKNFTKLNMRCRIKLARFGL